MPHRVNQRANFLLQLDSRGISNVDFIKRSSIFLFFLNSFVNSFIRDVQIIEQNGNEKGYVFIILNTKKYVRMSQFFFFFVSFECSYFMPA